MMQTDKFSRDASPAGRNTGNHRDLEKFYSTLNKIMTDAQSDNRQRNFSTNSLTATDPNRISVGSTQKDQVKNIIGLAL